MRKRRPISELTVDDLAMLFNRCFEGYLAPVSSTAEAMTRMIAVESIDPAASLIASDATGDVGLALAARRGDQSRVATMGVIESARRRGHGRWLMEALLADAAARGDRSMRLECIERNTGAIKLYREMGFEPVQRLVGYRASSAEILASREAPVVPLRQTTPRQIGDAMAALELTGLPWQIDAVRVRAYQGPAAAVQAGDAMALLDCRKGVTPLTLWVAPDKRRAGAGLSLLRAVASSRPDAEWTVPPLVPAGLASEFFEAAGFRPSELTQLEMVRPLR